MNFNGPKQLFIITVIHLMLLKICYKTVVGNIIFYVINIINIISLDLIWWLTQHYMYHASTVLTTVCREMIFKLHVPDFTWKFSVEDCINKLLAVLKSEILIFIFITFFFNLKLQSLSFATKNNFLRFFEKYKKLPIKRFRAYIQWS